MVQREVDPLTGARRHDILISADDMASLGLGDGDRVTLRSSTGAFTGTLRQAPIKSGNLEVHWPEGNVLLDAGRVDAASGEPDYNATVVVEPHAPQH
jgi:anaerobic selenocysteine-containing dehydrogenase